MRDGGTLHKDERVHGMVLHVRRAELDARGIPYKHVVIDKFSAEHAELAMRTGQCSVPYVFNRSGTLLGGYEREGDAPGLIGALAAMDEDPTARRL